MKIRKAFRYRLKPSEAQAEILSQFTGHCRFVWNKVLSLNLARLKEKQPLIWYHEADYWSKLWKRSEEYGFLKEAPAHCVQQKLKDLECESEVKNYTYLSLKIKRQPVGRTHAPLTH